MGAGKTGGVTLHSHGIRQAADGRRHLMGKNKQSDGVKDGKMKDVTMCCYSDVILFTKNRIKYI